MGSNSSLTTNTEMNLVLFLLYGAVVEGWQGAGGNKPGPGGYKPVVEGWPVAGGNNTRPGGNKPGGNRPGPGGDTEDCSGSTLPNSAEASEAMEICLEIKQNDGLKRTAKLAIPARTNGQKFPVIFYLHGNGGQGNTKPFAKFLGDDCIIVAPDGYENSWNVYSGNDRANDTQFILELITKIGKEIPEADMDNVNIAGRSNGAGLTYALLINTGADRPFRRAFPMVGSLIDREFHDEQFWKIDKPGVAVIPTFYDSFEYAHFHGTKDSIIKYWGQDPGPAFLKNAVVISAQMTDYIWAKAMGFTGAQIADSKGVDVGTEAKPAQVYKYLDGRCRHYKLIGEDHDTGPSHPVVQEVIREMILGEKKEGCEIGWNMFDGSCYKVFTDKMSWYDAKKKCKDQNADLASITSTSENKFVFELAKKNSSTWATWIGANDIAKEGTFTWADGTAWAFTNWNKEEPNDWKKAEDCVLMWVKKDGLWDDAKCNDKRRFICQMKKKN